MRSRSATSSLAVAPSASTTDRNGLSVNRLPVSAEKERVSAAQLAGGTLVREAKVVGLRDYVQPSLDAVERRRAQLWTVTFLVVGLVAAGLALLSLAESTLDGNVGVLNPSSFRIALLGVTLAFAAYLGEKEVHLRRLAKMLIDERVLSAALTNRLHERAALSAAASAVNASLALDETLAVILTHAVDLLAGGGGAVYLRDGKSLTVVASSGPGAPPRGTQVRIGAGLVGRVAAEKEPALAGADDAEGAPSLSMAVPLVHRSELEGVLVVQASEVAFGDYDVQLLGLFAESAAIAVGHARMYEAERSHVEDLLQLDQVKTRFVALVSHELKTPLHAIGGAVRTLRRNDLSPEHVGQFLDLIERQSLRLSQLVEDVLSLKRSEMRVADKAEPVDIGEVAREAARVSRLAGRPVDLVVNGEPLIVRGDSGAFSQILINLIDNAFSHGWGPVEVIVSNDDREGRVEVLDRGEGVAPEQVATIFDPFRRGDTAASPGVGLGLYLVRTLAEAHGGTVAVSDRPGGGANFTVRFPLPGYKPAGAIST